MVVIMDEKKNKGESESSGEFPGEELSPLPRHIAVIMDGNGRWAKARGLPRNEGHRAGAESVRNIVTECRSLGIGALTLYSFSTENWKRSKLEKAALWLLLRQFLKSELNLMLDKGIAFDTIGDEAPLEPVVRRAIDEVREKTSGGDKMRLTLALNYGGRDEIIQAVRQMARQVADRKMTLEEITKESFSQALYTAHLPDPDLLIRSGGEQRVSNFLLWQIAYTELWITPVLWPDFGRDHLMEALRDFAKRERRYGRVEV